VSGSARRSYREQDRWLVKQIQMADPLYGRPVRLGSAVSLVCASQNGGVLGVRRGRLEATEALNVEAFWRELDAWDDAENHQPAVLRNHW
jgi:hypothetical protein